MAEGRKGAAKAAPQRESGQVAEAPQSDKDASAAQASKHSVGTPAGAEDAGPGAGQEAPEDRSPRGQQRMHIGAGHVAAPIEAPDAAAQTDPPEGHSRSSSNPVAGVGGVHSYTGENHVKLVGDDGSELSADDLFEPHEENQAFRIVKRAVYEVFNYAGSLEEMSRRLFYKGQRLDLATAARTADAARLGQAQRAQEEERVKAADKAFYAAS